MEHALRHQIRHEYNKTGRHSNVTDIEADHVTIVLDLIQVKVMDYPMNYYFGYYRVLSIDS